MAALARENERDEERQRAANFQAFQSGLAQGMQKDPNNPAEDNSFQEKMQALQASERERKAAQEERDRAARADEATTARESSGGPRSAGTGATVIGAGDRKNQQDDTKKDDARKQEAARRDAERQQDEARKKDEARQREANRKAEADERARAAKDAEQRAFQDYLAAMRSGIRLHATKAFCTEGYCAAGTRPSVPGHGSSCIDVSFRATCVGTLNWSSGTLYNFVGAADTAPITPKPSCKVEDVRVEVTDVRGGCN